jgi:acetyl esterase/lipase
VLCPAYRLAPEHPFPAALNDVMAVVESLMPSSRPLLLGGDSAGGGLAASTVRLCIDRGVPVRALALLSAWLDLTVSSSSYEDNACTDPLFSRAAAEEATLLYLQGLSAREPLVSPVLGSVVGFPPTFVSIGAGEVLADEGRRFHQSLQTAGIRAELLAIVGMEHVAVTRNPQLTGAAQTLDALVRFIDRLLL